MFDSLIKKKKKTEMWLVDFYSPSCPPCQALLPEWRKLAKMLNGTANVGSVDCTKNMDVCNENGVNSWPTVRLYPSGKRGIAGAQ
ncbi:dnaJ homolog subfamily C member 10-like [Anneissia japonica]|uniref:dnaJ homolog subfamily C member 10-like n=1 Tax=Anneissia japonica TaxID=1529436 RepID=UPI001425B681|nr:dnaJ homolog subfamily C member 10-like [Anneissia japonica]XP_033123965.1 dnaJ homolog subfamily C member 10-like [Anneissia japonica]